MRFTLGRVVHFYYVAVLIAMTALFAYGAKFYWSSGLLNIEYISNLYDGTSKVKAVKERSDIDEVKKFIDGDRIKEANKVFARLESDIHDLKSIKSTSDVPSFDENFKKVKTELSNFQSAPELTTILNNISNKISSFEAFVTEKKWPTLTKMAINLRMKTSPGRLMQGGLYNFEKTQNLTQSINNDLEAMTNFTTSSGLRPEIKTAIINRMKPIKSDSLQLDTYLDDHKKFNRSYKEFATDYQAWFKFVEPEIALKKIQFEKSSQTILYSLIVVFSSFATALIVGLVLYGYSTKRGSQKTEKLILDTIKENLLPVEQKNLTHFSYEFNNELEKYRDYVHKRMTFGSIFQEAMPFAAILLDSNLNLIWGNSHFYEEWKLENFIEESSDSLSWDFLQRFTNLEDNSSVLNALRMSSPGVYKIQVKTAGIATPIPYEMHVSPAEYSAQKRIMIIFYPMSEVEERIATQRQAIIAPMMKLVDGYFNESIDVNQKNDLKNSLELAGGVELYLKFSQYNEKNESLRDDLTGEIERLESDLSDQRIIVSEIRKLLVDTFETQRESISTYNQLKMSVTTLLEARDQLEEQFKFVLNTSRELNKDQHKIITNTEKAERNVDDYIKSLKTITHLKSEFKDLKTNVDDFKSRIVQVLDQVLIFQNHEDDTQRLDQFLGKIKLEMKGFEKVLMNFNSVVTQLDVTVTKLDMMVESRERVELEAVRQRLDSLKHSLENAHFSGSRISQNAHSKDDELVHVIKHLVGNLKSEMKITEEMCRVSGLSEDHLKIISPETTI